MKGKILGAFLISIMIFGAFLWTQIEDQPSVMKNNIAPNNTHKSAPIKIRETMTLPYEMKVFIDDRYAYVDYAKMSEFISDLEAKFGFTVVSAKRDGITNYNLSYLKNFSYVVLPNPSFDNLTIDEQQAIVDYVNTTYGIALIMGDKDSYINIDTLNNISKEFGVEFLYGNVTDPTDYDYSESNPLAHVWTNTEIAQEISANGSFVVKMGTCTSLNITNPTLNDTWMNMYIVATGDNDTEFNNTVWDGDVIYFILVTTNSKGGILFSGATNFVRDTYWYPLYNNSQFALGIFEKSMTMRDLAIISYEVPSWPVYAGEIAYVNMTIKNMAEGVIENVSAGIEFSGAVELLNASNYVNISSLDPNETRTLVFALKAVGTSNVTVEFKVWGNETIVGCQYRAVFETLSLVVGARVSPDFIVLSRWNYTYLTINVTNMAKDANITNVNVTISLPSGLETYNNTSYHYDFIRNRTFEIIDLYIEASQNGTFKIDINVDSDNESKSLSVRLLVFSKPFILYDQGHDQYYKYHATYYGMSEFVSILREYGELYLNNGTFRSDIIGNASLVIIPNLGKNLTSDETTMLWSYAESGGALALFGDWYSYFNPTSYNAITERFGIVWNDGEIIDEESYDYASYYPLLETYCINPVATYMTIGLSELYVRSSTFLNVSPPAFAIVRGNPASYTVDSEGNPTGINGTEIIAIAAVKAGSGKILAIGGTKTVDKYGMGYDSNKEFIRRALDWLLGKIKEPANEVPEVRIRWNIGSYDYEGTTYYFANVYITVMEDWEIYHVEVIVDGQVLRDLYFVNVKYYDDEITLTTSGAHNITVIAYDYEGKMTKLSKSVEVPEPTVLQNVTTTVTSTTTETIVSTTISPSISYSTIERVPLAVLGGVAVLVVAWVASLAMLLLRRKTV